MTLSKCLLFLLLLIAALFVANGKRNFEVYLDDCNCTVIPIYSHQCSCHIDKSINPPKANLELQLHHTLKDLHVFVELYAKTSNNQTFTLYNSTSIDVCKVFRGQSSGNIVAIMKSFLLNVGKLPDKCPIDKDFNFNFHGITMDTELFPTYVPEARYVLRCRLTEESQFIIFFEIIGYVKQNFRKRFG